MQRALAIWFALCLSACGATYYLAPGGSDAANGSLAAPWKTYTHADAAASPGDMILVQPGIYTNGGTFFQSTKSGITYLANGAVSNQCTFYLPTPSNVISGFIWGSGYTTNTVAQFQYWGDCIHLERGASWTVVTNCAFENNYNTNLYYLQLGTFQVEVHDADGLYGSVISNCTIINCRFRNLTGVIAFDQYGANWLIQGCTFDTGRQCQVGRCFGSNIVFRANYCTNYYAAEDRGEDGGVAGQSPHPDLFNLFGDTGKVINHMIVEDNYIVGFACQLFDASMASTGAGLQNTNDANWGVIFRNNVVEDSVIQSSIHLPNMLFYNNTFRRALTAPGLQFLFDDPNWSGCRGWATGGGAANNVFDQCSTAWTIVSTGPNQNNLTNGAGVVKGRTAIFLDNAVFTLTGTYSGLAGTITGGTLFCPCGDLYTWGAGYFAAGVFNLATNGVDVGACDYASTQQGAYLNGTMGFRLNTTSSSGEAQCLTMPVYVAGAAAMGTITNNSGWNWNGAPGERGALTGTDPKLAATNGWPALLATPRRGSPLIGVGTNLWSADITNDFSGNARPNGAQTIGAFEPDPSLVAFWPLYTTTNLYSHYAGSTPDITGYGGDAINWNITNSVYLTNGPTSDLAAQFKYVGTIPPPDPYQDPFSQYWEVTNVSAFQYLTNFTISIWAWADTNADMVMELLDSAYYQQHGSWSLSRNSDTAFGFYTSGAGTNRLSFPAYVWQAGGGSPNLGMTNWGMLTVAASCPSNQVIGYYNGQPFATNTMYDTGQTADTNLVTSTLAIGAMWHQQNPPTVFPNGSLYPNAGYFVGRMSGVRIYNRQLTGVEVAGLYANGPTAQVSSGGGGSGGSTNAPGMVSTGTGVTIGAGVTIQ